MKPYRPKDRVVTVVQWFPPEDPRHDPFWPVTRSGTECLDREVKPGEIGWSVVAEKSGPPCPACGLATREDVRRYWIRTTTSSATYLEPGRYIVKDSWRIAVLSERQLLEEYEVLQRWPTQD